MHMNVLWILNQPFNTYKSSKTKQKEHNTKRLNKHVLCRYHQTIPIIRHIALVTKTREANFLSGTSQNLAPESGFTVPLLHSCIFHQCSSVCACFTPFVRAGFITAAHLKEKTGKWPHSTSIYSGLTLWQDTLWMLLHRI